MSQHINLFWFRRDLRLHDNAAFSQALYSGLPVMPVFIFDKNILDELEDKTDQRVAFIHAAVQSMHAQLKPLQSGIQVFYDYPEPVFQKLLEQYTIHTVFTNHDYEPYGVDRDKGVQKLLAANGVLFQTCKDQVIFEKDEIVKADRSCYSIYTPYSNAWLKTLTARNFLPSSSDKTFHRLLQFKPVPFPALAQMNFKDASCQVSVSPKINEQIIREYHKTRDIPSIAGTSQLGVHLRFGTVSIRHLVHSAVQHNATFLKELVWREFFMQHLWRKPALVNHAFKPAYDHIQWRNKEDEFKRWCTGQTGYPIVDAGMRQLNATGFMHNRVRMVTASFLVKHLLIDWRWGEAYFAKKLLDYELSSNNGNWQWVAGCGCDAAPYFRIFNPAAQTKRFDASQIYIQKWVPEHGTGRYAKPMVQHEAARERCLKVYKDALRKSAKA